MSALRYSLAAFACCVGYVGCNNDGWPAQCPSPVDEQVWYFHETWEGRDVCATDELSCPTDTEPILVAFPETEGIDCGCGCFGPEGYDWPRRP